MKHSFLQDLAINVPRLAEDLAKLLVMIYKDALKVIPQLIKTRTSRDMGPLHHLIILAFVCLLCELCELLSVS